MGRTLSALVGLTSLLLLTLPTGSLAQEELPRVAVLTFQAESRLKNEAEAIAEEVRQGFVNNQRFIVVDRTLTVKIMEEWETQQAGITEQEKAIRVGRLHNVHLLVTGKLHHFSSGGWQISAVLLDAQTGVASRAATIRHKGEFFDLIDQKVPRLASRLAGDEAAGDTEETDGKPETGEVWEEPLTGMEFVYVPGGEFDLGCGTWVGECADQPENFWAVARTTVSSFWIGKFEVTQGQWQAIMQSNPSHYRLGEKYPVDNISWDSAQEFIRRLNENSEGETYRLPTEAEWEFACRAGGKKVEFGTRMGKLSPSLANYSSGNSKSDGPKPVGSYPPNELGIHEMTGNVAEFVEDSVDTMDSYKQWRKGGLPSNPFYRRGNQHLFIGGMWPTGTHYSCAQPVMVKSDSRFKAFGFRLVRLTKEQSERNGRLQGMAAMAAPAADLWREPVTGMELVRVEGGEFAAGCGSWAGTCLKDDLPPRRERVNTFWMGKTEVTQGQWAQLMGKNPSRFATGPHYPVENVAWDEIQEFLKRLSAKSPGARFRLPTDMEFEYACRAGGKNLLYGTSSGEWSGNLGQAWNNKTSKNGFMPVGSFPPNPLGLYDMSGNVWEWTQSRHFRNRAMRTLMGGNATTFPFDYRCVGRGSALGYQKGHSRGFRVVKTP